MLFPDFELNSVINAQYSHLAPCMTPSEFFIWNTKVPRARTGCGFVCKPVWCVYTGLCDAPSAAERWVVGSICFALPLSDAAAG